MGDGEAGDRGSGRVGDGAMGSRRGFTRYWSAVWRASFFGVIAYLSLQISAACIGTALLVWAGARTANQWIHFGWYVSLLGAVVAFAFLFWREYNRQS